MTGFQEHTAADIHEAWVTSADGTQLRVLRVGAGPSLVVVHGSISCGSDWMHMAHQLSSTFTCYLMDRRGREPSTERPSPGEPPFAYSIEREYEDIEAVLALAGPRSGLFGHSFGAVCALGAATRVAVERLVLYDPPLAVGGPVAGGSLHDYRRAVGEGRLDDALALGLTRFVGLAREQVEAMRARSLWRHMRSLAATWTRELDALDRLGPNPAIYTAIRCPVLLLGGSESAAHPFKDSVATLARVLRSARTVTLSGQGHVALRTAQELAARSAMSFLCEPSHPRDPSSPPQPCLPIPGRIA